MGNDSSKELPEYDNEKCAVCEQDFRSSWTEERSQKEEELIRMFPLFKMDIPICFSCYTKLDARLPYRASMN